MKKTTMESYGELSILPSTVSLKTKFLPKVKLEALENMCFVDLKNVWAHP